MKPENFEMRPLTLNDVQLVKLANYGALPLQKGRQQRTSYGLREGRNTAKALSYLLAATSVQDTATKLYIHNQGDSVAEL